MTIADLIAKTWDSPLKAKLEGHTVVPVKTDTPEELIAWATWMEDPKNRIVRRTLLSKRRKIWVSTVFLAVNHGRWDIVCGDLWFETMIFGTSLDEEQRHYPDWDSAMRGHAEMVKRARQARWLKNTSGLQLRRETPRFIRRHLKLQKREGIASGT